MLLFFPLPRLFGSSQGLLCQASTELEQTSGYLAHDLAHFVVGRMKRRGSMAASPLDCVSDNLSLATIHQVAAVGVVIQGARGGIAPNRLLHPVFAPAHLPYGICHLLSHLRRQLGIRRRTVLSVHIVVDPSPHSIVTRISEVHSWVVALVFIGTPAVEDGLTIAVQVD